MFVFDKYTIMAASPNNITAQVTVNASIEKIWQLWTNPKHIAQWNNLSADWHNVKVENDARTGGKFLFVMALKDGSFSFDHAGNYTEVKVNELIAYTLNDGRKTIITFTGSNPGKITENFEPEASQPAEMQRGFCQAVLDGFKKYAEAHT